MDTSKLYKTQWLAYFKNGLQAPTIVYGESEDDAKKNAFAYYRKNYGMIDTSKLDDVVKNVQFVG